MSEGLPQPQSKGFLGAVREVVLVGLGALGNPRDAFLRVRDLEEAGLAKPRASFIARGGAAGQRLERGAGPALQPVYVVDLTPPPAPTGFSASAGTTQILFETDPPIYLQGNGHARTHIYAANYSGAGPLPVFSDAVEFTSFVGNIAAVPFDPASNLRLWAKWESVDGVLSAPAGGTNGIAATTNLIDDAKIANLSAGKILAGSIAVGQYIQSADYVAGVSGWRIATLIGGGAFVEIRGNAVFGGTIFASAGTIGGATIGSTYIRSTGYALGTQGWNFNSDGTGQIGGFVVAQDHIRSDNYSAGAAGWKITKAGAIEAGDITLFGGTIKNSTDSFHMNMNASGSSLLLRAGALTAFGYAGNHYPVEITADGHGFFGRGVISGGAVLASSPGGGYSIPMSERPAVFFFTTPPAYVETGGGA